jgi:hypothetical protein
MPIAFDFLVNGGIERRGTEMKKALNMGGVLKVFEKLYFGLLTLNIV